MTDLALSRPARPRPLIFRVPLLGRVARELADGPDDTIWYALMIPLTAVVLAVKAWGLPALAMIALALVPLMFVILLLITLGR